MTIRSPHITARVEPTDEEDTVALVVMSEANHAEFRMRTDDLSDLIGSAIASATAMGTVRDEAPAIIQAVAAGMNPDAYRRLTDYHFIVDVWAAEFPALVDAWADAAAMRREIRDAHIRVQEARGVPGGIYRQNGRWRVWGP